MGSTPGSAARKRSATTSATATSRGRTTFMTRRCTESPTDRVQMPGVVLGVNDHRHTRESCGKPGVKQGADVVGVYGHRPQAIQ